MENGESWAEAKFLANMMSRVPLPALPCPSQTGERGLQGLGLGLLHVSFFKSIF